MCRGASALGDTVTPLVILAVSVALNIAGDLLFVLVLKAGVRGAAAATVLAQILAFVICWLYMLRRYEMLRLVREEFRDADMAMMKNMLGSGLSMGFMSSLVNIGSLTPRRRSISWGRISSWRTRRHGKFLRFL